MFSFIVLSQLSCLSLVRTRLINTLGAVYKIKEPYSEWILEWVAKKEGKHSAIGVIVDDKKNL